MFVNNLEKLIRVSSQPYRVYVRVRPGAEDFIREMAKIYEVVIFTASLAEYANPVIDKIDPQGFTSIRLFRENCRVHNNIFVKDLATLNRDIKDLIIIDNSPTSFMLQPLNAIHIKNFFCDQNDTELIDLIPFLKLLQNFNDVRPVHEWLHKYNHFEKFSFTNTKGARIIFYRNPNDDQLLDLKQEDDESTGDSTLSIIESKQEERKTLINGHKRVPSHQLKPIQVDVNQEVPVRNEANINSPINSQGGFILQEDEDDEEIH